MLSYLLRQHGKAVYALAHVSPPARRPHTHTRWWAIIRTYREHPAQGLLVHLRIHPEARTVRQDDLNQTSSLQRDRRGKGTMARLLEDHGSALLMLRRVVPADCVAAVGQHVESDD